MAKPASKVETIKKSDRRWQSDVIVDMIKRYGFEYIALNPGASYRGLHDSLVNYGENDPPMLLCQHEKIAVQIAHGYARAKGKPMIAIVHDLVGLLHAPMGIYYAYLDRAPVFIIGATGPMAEPKRRPFIDWIHTANVPGRSDPQFRQVGLPTDDRRRRAGRLRARLLGHDECAARSDLYVLRRGLAGSAVGSRSRNAAAGRDRCSRTPRRRIPPALEKAADTLAAANRRRDYRRLRRAPAAWLESRRRAGRDSGRLGVGRGLPAQFPQRSSAQPHLDPDGCYKDVDVVLTLDIADFEKPTHVRDIATRTVVSKVPANATWIDIGFTDIEISKWSMDYARPFLCAPAHDRRPGHHRAAADQAP